MKTDPLAVLGAMKAELRRSMDGLHIPDSPRCYFVAYALRHHHSLALRAAYGSLLRSRERDEGEMYVEVRVGDRHFDNVMDGGLHVSADERESSDWRSAPDDLDPEALRVALWKLTQIKFDEAQEDYYDHRKAMVSEFLRDEVDSFSEERPVEHIEELSDDPFPREVWEPMLVEISERFADYPDVYDPWIGLRVERMRRWLCTSEGTKVVTQDVYAELIVEGWVLTEDGVYVQGERAIYLRDLDRLPDRAGIEAMVDDLLEEFDELRDAESPGSFIGPALLAGQAACTMFHEALGHRLEGERMVARGETRTFANRVGDRVLPPGLDVYDDPTSTDPGGGACWGGYRVDDEGVSAQRAVLIEDGILRGFLHSRAPIPGAAHSNGHGRHDGMQRPMARMSNLVVEGKAGAGKTWEALEDELIELAKAQGKQEAVVITRIRGGETSTSSYEFQVFKGELAEVYLIDVETRKRRRIRDIELIGTPLAAMQRIVGFGGDPEPDYGYCYAESGSIPVSGVAPAVLVTELELQQRSTMGFHEPLLPPPFADDGSRGRIGGLRERGRRKRDASGPG